MLKRIRSIPGLKCFVKEAKSIKGLPDIIGCVNGRMFMLEVKKSLEEFNKKDSRQYLQEHILKEYQSVGAFTSFIYPEIEEEILEKLRCL